MKERELKRQKTVARFAAKRAALKAAIVNPSATEEEVWAAQQKLQKMPRDASAVRLTASLSCNWSSTRGIPQVCPSRIKLRETMMRGEVPGLKKASWYECLENEHARYFGGYVHSHPQRANGR